jgi:hypothetical protein
MLLRKSLMALALCSITATACSHKHHQVVKTIDTKSIRNDSSLNSSQKAERLALAAEQLVSPGSFMYAKDVVDQALSIDSDNKRAQMIDALIAPLMATKGILERVKPIAERNEKSKAKYEEVMAKVDKKPAHALKTFLLDGKQDIVTEADAQSFTDSIRNAFDKQRTFFKNNKNLDLTFNLSDLFSAAALNKEDSCYMDTDESGVYKEYCLEDTTPAVLEYKLNRADNEAIQQIAAGMEIYISLLNSYDVSGALAVSDKYDNTNANSNEVREELLKNKSFGTLRGSSGLNGIVSMGMDAISGIRYAAAAQDELCPAGVKDKSNRPEYVFTQGICISDRKDTENPLENILKTVELALKGEAISHKFTGDKGEYTTVVTPVSILMGSVKDVRDLGLGFNQCGNVVGVGDATLGGVFPRKDVNVVLNLDNTYPCQN